jgi:hypothetical protein
MGKNDAFVEQEQQPTYLYYESSTIPPSYVHSYISPFSPDDDDDDESSKREGFGTVPVLVVAIVGAIVFFLLLLLALWRKSVTRRAAQEYHDDDSSSVWDDSSREDDDTEQRDGHGSSSLTMDSHDSAWDENTLRPSDKKIKPDYMFDSSAIIDLHVDEHGIEMGTA